MVKQQMLKTDECTKGCLPPLSSSEDFTIDDVDVLNPPLPSSHPFHPEPWMRCEPNRNMESENSSSPVIVGESPLLEPFSLTVPIRSSPYECTLCHKMFGTANTLNKHLQTHQQERPHVCPICQQAFKRHDHLNGHMLTHQKRKQFRCAEPGCQKSFCDSHSLKRHYISQHGLPFIPPMSQSPPHLTHPAHSAATKWESVDSAAYLAGSTAHSNYHPMFLTQPKPTLDTQQKVADYSGFFSFNGYKGFAPPSGLQLNNYSEQNISQSMPILVLDTWMQRSDKSPRCPGELHPPQWAPEPSNISTATIPSLPPGVDGPSPHGWESVDDFPVSDLQVLEEMLSSHPCSEVGNGECLLKPASPEKSYSPSKQEQSTYGQMNSEGKPQVNTQLHSFEPTASSDSSVTSTSFPNTVFIHSSSSLPNKPNPVPPIPPPPAIVLPCLYSVLKSDTCNTKTDSKRKRERRKKMRAVDLPAPPLSIPRPTSLLAPRRPRPRPHYLVSPSQVAMASFSSDSNPCQTFQGRTISVPGEGQECSDRILPSSHQTEHSNKAKSSSGPYAPCIKMEPYSPEPGERGPQTLRSPSRTEHMPLSPLVIPVSVPVSVETDPDSPSSLNAENPQNGSGRSKRSRRLDFMKTLIIPPPMLPQPSQRRLLGEEGGGAPWCRAAGGYPSQLRSPMYLADHLLNPSFQPPPYTPPPMLSPLRPGTGLYFSTLPWLHPGPPPPSSYTASLDGADGISLMMDDTVVNIEPRINVGQRFQAEIPPIRNLLLMLYDEHPAQLVWAPWGDISSNMETQRGVTELMDLCCSSILPGGGTNTELALHCLHEVQGDILAALDLLLVRGDFRSSTHPLSDYHYPGSDDWSPQEKKLFRKALLTHEKDFQLIHSVLQTKSVSQCVEYYYAMKKLKKFKQRSRGSDKKEAVGEEPQMESPGCYEDNHVGRRGPRRTLTKPGNRTKGVQEEQTTTGGALEYICRECGRVFDKVKSRSAHMKTHRQQEREWLTKYVCPMGCPADNPHEGDPGQDSDKVPLLYCTRGILYK
ncbi:zinc finger protein 541 isoform X1 [Coregonus clupeaformis]|uniref:zinc finger protein 541 isoform X1 n=2 Tax=Coregonus clupeaformis TaxID=59861 RepID=UPI001E1C9A50|nr:zinc finger protein 541 isoform X1 [Coregonus clupeaformis]